MVKMRLQLGDLIRITFYQDGIYCKLWRMVMYFRISSLNIQRLGLELSRYPLGCFLYSYGHTPKEIGKLSVQLWID